MVLIASPESYYAAGEHVGDKIEIRVGESAAFKSTFWKKQKE